jgi:hypothetical protein
MACLILPAEIHRLHEPLLWRGSFTLTEAGRVGPWMLVRSWRHCLPVRQPLCENGGGRQEGGHRPSHSSQVG